MTEIDGHFNMPDKVGYTCRLLRKAVSRHGARLVVVADRATLDAVDQSLWTMAPTEFVAHCRIGDEPYVVRRSPVVLAEEGSQLPLPVLPILVNLGAEVPAGFERFERLIDIVSEGEADRRSGRVRWAHYKAGGFAIRHHRYGEGAAG